MKIEMDFEDLKKNCDRILVRRYLDMEDRFIGEVKGNPVIYRVYIGDFGNFESGLTVIEEGKVEKEFFMTKGHRHKKPMDELYFLVKGKGVLVVKKGESFKKIEMKKGKLYRVPGEAGHRLVNVGRCQLEVLTIYSKNAGHDYRFKF